ncbi:acyl-CoA thioesterase [Shewanella surugensis]|uniref:Acyl-CoA thioesterase n=1 Tax=Shewanella surugensis TaxID=212020 RepID=A0ABT0LA11_9GAMM|nr:acyl-CoA thioesterase [Shewanella surugensis]MCL1124195.1 acyl-CoA thioesterase [Shewanella surugensis]
MSGTENGITLRFLAEPADVNFGGKVHGGAVMKWIDLAGYACAAGWSGKYCITAYAGGIRFLKPIYVGNIVEVRAKVSYTGRTSMHLAIEVKAGDPKGSERHLTTNCIVIMVAVDDEGSPTPVPEWIPVTKEEVRNRESALKLMELRKQLTHHMETHSTI